MKKTGSSLSRAVNTKQRSVNKKSSDINRGYSILRKDLDATVDIPMLSLRNEQLSHIQLYDRRNFLPPPPNLNPKLLDRYRTFSPPNYCFTRPADLAKTSTSSSLLRKYSLDLDVRRRRPIQREGKRYTKNRTKLLPSIPENELLPHEYTQSYKVLVLVMRLFQIPDLCICRLVCHQWNSVATSYLQKTKFKLKFTDGKLKQGKVESQKHMTALLNLLQNSVNIPFPFPCSKFVFNKSHNNICNAFLTDKLLQTLLSTQRIHIEELVITRDPLLATSESKVMILSQLQKLITNQLPYLHSLELYIPIIALQQYEIFEEGNNCHCDKYQCITFDKKETNFKRKHEVTNYYENTIKNWNIVNSPLKILRLSGCIFPEIFDLITKVAPNLIDIVTTENDYMFFLEPINRLKYLKQLLFYPRVSEDLNLFERIIYTGGDGSLKLHSIQLCLMTIVGPIEEFSLETRNRVVNVINRLIEGSWDSLEHIRWGNVALFIGGIILPEVMLNLKIIQIDNPLNLGGQNVFYPGFPWSKTFPNLRQLHLFDIMGPAGFVKFLECLHLETMKSVKNVDIAWNTTECITMEHLQLTLDFFPCARVSQSRCVGCYSE